MAARNYVDLFGSKRLKLKAHFNKFIPAYGFPHSLLAYLIVLAEGTAKGTAGNKNGSASAKNRNEGFFTKMKAGSCNFQVLAFPAETALAAASVSSAVSWTLSAF